MSELGIALTGIVFGALASGGVQVFQTWRSQRLKARIAARLLNGDISLAEKCLEDIVEMGRWPDAIVADFATLADTWQVQREAFAAGVNAIEWNDVAVACRHIGDLNGARPLGHPMSDEDRASLAALVVKASRAREATTKRAYTKREAHRYLAKHSERQRE